LHPLKNQGDFFNLYSQILETYMHPEQKKNKSGELTPSELAGIHITDSNHTIDDQKIRNLKVGAAVDGTSQIKKQLNKKSGKK
jgi:hypothetical protein